MTPERWTLLRDLLDRALDLPAAERSAFLDDACGEDADLRREVQQMLDAEATAETFLHAPAADKARALFDDLPNRPEPDILPERIGIYHVIEPLGRGGMGNVYLAERADGQFRQRVALKVIRRGLDTDDILARFRYERQILASLQHPNIATLLDGGVTEDGRPYFVMEYVQGQPITQYADAQHLRLDQRLALFQTVCKAVQYAHQNLVVHRDLKPGNILVTDEGQVKLLDFGIAKLVEGGEADALAMTYDSPLTRTGLHLMTPEYAAPEQVRGDLVSTATDVYQLGIILYELLTGQRPFQIKQRVLREIERVILEEEPTRPSTLIGAVTEATALTITSRSTTLDRLRRRLSGDLDNIVLKALKKAPERRYASAEQFADDIRRHLEGLPVQARAETVGYRVQKFVQRHRVGVLATAAIAVLLLTVAALSIRFAFVSQRQSTQLAAERDRAEAVTDFMLAAFQQADRGQTQGEVVTAQQVLDDAATEVADLSDQPATQATLLHAMGQAYEGLGLFATADSLYGLAIQLPFGDTPDERRLHARSLGFYGWTQRRAGGLMASDSALTLGLSLVAGDAEALAEQAALYNNLGLLRITQERLPEADSLLALSIALEEQRQPTDTLAYAEGLANWANAKKDRGDYAASDSLLTYALTLRQAIADTFSIGYANDLNNLGLTRRRLGQYAPADSLYLTSIDMVQRLYGSDEHTQITATLSNRAGLMLDQRRFGEALTVLEDVVARSRREAGPIHPQVVGALNNLGGVHFRMANFEQADALLKEALLIEEQLYGPDDPALANRLNILSIIQHSAGNLDASEAYAHQAFALLTRAEASATVEGAPETPSTDVQRPTQPSPMQWATAEQRLGELASTRGNYAEAEDRLRSVYRIYQDHLAPDHPRIADMQIELVIVLGKQDEYDEALALVTPALESRQQAYGDQHWKTAQAKYYKGDTLSALERYDEAEPLLLQALETLREIRGEAHVSTNNTRAALRDVYTRTNRPDEAAKYAAVTE
ncbi:MAG: hypothetical protein RhofKO_12820 [Rhodothermales bacterium]